MPFITGLYLIDAPASALNNGESVDIEAQVKQIKTAAGNFPYVSAQSFRYWLRSTLETEFANEWKASPVYNAGAGKKQQAYTAGDPITYDDDDLLGYMRAEKEETVTRVSPFRTGTLVSLAPVNIVSDFGVMARVKKEEGDKEGVLLHQHQFYRTVLQGLFSLDLNAVGTFTNQLRSGFQNLGKDGIKAAEAHGLEKIDTLRAYRLPKQERIRRVQILLRALGRIQGGAKQTLHYTDVNPSFVMMAVTRGGNHAFGRVVTTDRNGLPMIHAEALQQVSDVFGEDLLSPVYVGRAAGFMDDSQSILDSFNLPSVHPRQAFDALAADLAANPNWLD